MPADEFSLKVSFLVGFFIVLSLFVSRYFRRDPVVSPLAVFSRYPWMTLLVPSSMLSQL
jgi:hypothetical protein